MKRELLGGLFALFLLLSIENGYAQQKKEIYDSKAPVVWLGLDFSQLKVINENTSNKEIEITIPKWNNLIVNEPKKYDLAEAFDKDKVEIRIEKSMDLNEKIENNDFVSKKSTDYNRLKQSDIEKVAKMYQTGKNETGILMIVEAFDKSRESGAVWVTYVNLADGSVILTSRMEGKAGGFGLRNYYAAVINKILKAWPDELKDMKKKKK